jgi:hypothetical protein
MTHKTTTGKAKNLLDLQDEDRHLQEFEMKFEHM